MRLLPIWAAALLMMMSAPDLARAQSLASSAGPAELPPASFTGRNFVDSRGCMYIRAGSGNRVTWVPRVTRNAKVMCGFQPTFAPGAGRAVGVAPVQVAQPVIAPTAPKPRAAPVKPRLNHSVPKGYVSAWTDGRLNPNRGPRTAAGDAQMAAIWTNKVPMQMRSTLDQSAQPTSVASTGSSRGKSKSIAGTAGSLTTKFFGSSKSPQANGRFIQIGTFADPNNAARAMARIQQMGLPAARQSTTMNGRSVQVVLAGPVAPDLAMEARQILRNAGYSDAFLR